MAPNESDIRKFDLPTVARQLGVMIDGQRDLLQAYQSLHDFLSVLIESGGSLDAVKKSIADRLERIGGMS